MKTKKTSLLTTPLDTLLFTHKASVRLRNLMSEHGYRWGQTLTIEKLMIEWPGPRLKNECFGFGPKAKRELRDFLYPIFSMLENKREQAMLSAYIDTLEPRTVAEAKAENGGKLGPEWQLVPKPPLPSLPSVNNPARTCVHCGCTDDRACPGGCSWTVLHKATNTGVCSQCQSDTGRGKLCIGDFLLWNLTDSKTDDVMLFSKLDGGFQTTQAKIEPILRDFFNANF